MNPVTGEKWNTAAHAFSRAGQTAFQTTTGSTTPEGRYSWSEFGTIKAARFVPATRPSYGDGDGDIGYFVFSPCTRPN
jgi:hypothetical protein